jgi:hypothetical protein
LPPLPPPSLPPRVDVQTCALAPMCGCAHTRPILLIVQYIGHIHTCTGQLNPIGLHTISYTSAVCPASSESRTGMSAHDVPGSEVHMASMRANQVSAEHGYQTPTWAIAGATRRRNGVRQRLYYGGARVCYRYSALLMHGKTSRLRFGALHRGGYRGCQLDYTWIT